MPERAADARARAEALIEGPMPSDPSLLALLVVQQAWQARHIERLPQMAAAATRDDPLVDPDSGGFALTYVAGALGWIDETARALELLDAGLRRARELGDPLAEIQLHCVAAWAHLYRGEIRAARAELDAVSRLDELDWPPLAGAYGQPLVIVCLEEGDLVAARAALQRTEPALRLPGRDWFAGVVAAAAGDDAAALECFLAAGRQVEQELGMVNPGCLPWRASAAMAALRLEDHDQARELIAPAIEQARHAGVARALGIGLRVSGLIDEDLGRLEQSVAVLRDSPAPLELARSLMFLGITLRRLRQPRDARGPLGEALSLASDCGSDAVSERALAELRAAGGRPRRTQGWGAGALTASERKRRAARRRGPDDPPDRHRVVPQPQDRRGPSHRELPQAAHHLPGRARRGAGAGRRGRCA